MVNRVTRRASGARSGPPRQRRGLVGETPIAHQFFAGHYAEIARTVFDAPGAVLEAADVAFAVGALTFLGRLDDARTCFEAARLRGAQLDERTLAASCCVSFGCLALLPSAATGARRCYWSSPPPASEAVGL